MQMLAHAWGERHDQEESMMKVLLINGSPNKHGCTYTALNEIAVTLKEEGIDSDIIYLGKQSVAGCIACGTCRKTGACVFRDQVNEVAAKLDEYDGMVVGSPVYYAGPSAQVCAFMDRLFFSGGGMKMSGKLAASVVSCRRGGASAAFDRLNKYFGISNMHIVGSQYWNQVHGFTPDDVRKDLEGLQTMRTLARNMAWLLKCIEAGKEKGIEPPVHEPKVATNFID